MSDYWTSLATEGYISMTAHFVDDQWNFHNSVLATRKVQQMKSVQSQMSLVLNLRALWCYAYSWIRDTNPSPFCLRRWEPLYEMQSKCVSSVTFNPMILSHTVQNRIQIHKITHKTMSQQPSVGVLIMIIFCSCLANIMKLIVKLCPRQQLRMKSNYTCLKKL